MSGDSQAQVSVIIPARNEEANVERAVRSVASQTGVPLEVIVVDDQSDDRTGEILEGLRSEIPSLRVLRIDSLPEGWLGKPYALACGAKMASGAWLLFTDADTEHQPGSLHELLERAENKRVDLLSLSPGQLTFSWWEKAVIPRIYVWLAKRFRFDEVNDPASSAAAANGQYILIRREVYEKAGGHEAVRGELLEDVALAKRVKSSGGRLLFLPGARWVQTRMYRTFAEMWQGWTKNLYLLADRKLTALLAEVAAAWLLDLLPLAAVPVVAVAAATGRLRWPFALGLILACFASAVWRAWRYVRALHQLGLALGLLRYRIRGATLVSLLMLDSARRYRRGRIEWKGRTYLVSPSAGRATPEEVPQTGVAKRITS